MERISLLLRECWLGALDCRNAYFVWGDCLASESLDDMRAFWDQLNGFWYYNE